MTRYSLVILGFAFASLWYGITVFFDLDLFERGLYLLESYEIDELVIPIFLFTSFVTYDQIRKNRLSKEKIAKMQIYEAMLASSFHVVNNFLNQMQLFRYTAQKTKDFDQEVLKHYDNIVKDVIDQLESLRNVSEIDEGAIHEAVAPKSKD